MKPPTHAGQERGGDTLWKKCPTESPAEAVLPLPACALQAKNALENYAYSVKNTLADPAVGGKLEAGDKERLQKAVEETIDWLDHNQVG